MPGRGGRADDAERPEAGLDHVTHLPPLDPPPGPARPGRTHEKAIDPTREKQMTTQEIPEQLLDGYADILTRAAATGRRLTREELTSRRALGAQAATAGYTWRVLIREHLNATRLHRPATGDPDHLLATAEQAIDAFAEGYERAQRQVVRQEEAAPPRVRRRPAVRTG